MLIDPKWMRFYARMSGAVLAKVILVVAGLYVGNAIDAKLGTYPIFLFVCVTACLGLGIFWIVWLAEKETARLNAEEPPK